MKFTTGAVFGNRYTLGERIAVGGMGEVWEATDQVLGRIVAIKLLSPALADQRGFAERFREEARNTAALSHPNIAAVYDYGEDSGANWLVMELVKGEPLSAIVGEQGAQSSERTIAICAQAALALQAAHDRGVIHRDVKPANILVKPDGAVKLTDFGIARATDAAPITRTGEVMGTAQYISPEQATGQPVSPASDIYALGCVAYEMLTGRRPFDEGSPVATAMAHVSSPPPPLPDSVPASLAGVVMACLAKTPHERPRSGQELADALRGAPTAGFARTEPIAATERLNPATRVAPAGVAAAPPPRQPRTASVPRQQPDDDDHQSRGWLWALVGVVALLIVGVAIYAIATGLGDGDAEPTPTDTETVVTESPEPEETGPETVQVTASDYRGMMYDQAASQLSALGLNAQRNDVPSTTPAGQVVGVAPSGRVDVGSTITLDVSEGPTDPEPVPEETTDPTPEEETPAPEEETPTPEETTEEAPEEAPATGAAGATGPANSGGAGAGAGVGVPAPEDEDTADIPTSTATPEE